MFFTAISLGFVILAIISIYILRQARKNKKKNEGKADYFTD